MNTVEVGKKIVALCKEGKALQAIQELYSPDIVSVEAQGMPGMPAEMKGLEAIIGKAKWWEGAHEVHSAKAEGPWPHGDRFAIRFTYDITNKESKKRTTMDEVGLYTVKDGKVVREEFFYGG